MKKLKKVRRLPSKFEDYSMLTYKEAVTGPDKERWQKAINEETNPLKKTIHRI